MYRNIWIALAILVIAVAWFAYDLLQPEEVVASNQTVAEQNAASQALAADLPPSKVRGRVIRSEEHQRISRLSGRTENKRTVQVRGEVGGLVVNRPVELGDRVQEGSPLCELEKEEREMRILEAKDMLREMKLEYAGQMSLRNSGLQIERQIAAAKARVTQAEAALLQREKELARATIKAPFDGFIEEIHVETGDLLQPGSACATLIDLDPMRVIAQASEKDIHYFEIGATAVAELPSGETIEGTVTFIGQQSETSTRTFMIEVLVANPDYSIRSGLTAELLIPLDSFDAHKVPVALLGLNDVGETGVRIVGSGNQVVFNPIEIVSEEADGIWVTGLPEVTTLITVGQDFVIPGETVDVVFEDEI